MGYVHFSVIVVGQQGAHSPRRRSTLRAVREPFDAHGSSAYESLSKTLRAVNVVVAVGVEQSQVGVPAVRPVAIPVMQLGYRRQQIMPMVSFYTRFRDLAAKEMRSATVRGRPGIPDGEYGFLELYCDEPECDCRRVVIDVVSPTTGPKIWATINYGWESVAYYEKWMGDKETAQECQGATLDPLNPQTEHSPAPLQ